MTRELSENPSLQGDARLPLYHKLADRLRDEIANSRLRPGDRVPSENELADQYGLATGTVRRALAELVAAGLLERIHGRGTYVRRPSFDRSLFRFFRPRDAAGEPAVPASRILDRSPRPAPAFVAAELAIEPQADAIFIRRLRLIDDTVILAEEIWLAAEPFAALMQLPIEDIGPLLYPIYDSVCGHLIARAEETLTAEAASADVATLLRIPAATPVMVIDRTAKGYDNRPLEWRRSRGRADLFRYHTEIL